MGSVWCDAGAEVMAAKRDTELSAKSQVIQLLRY
jgi:hypothetical protein